MLVFIIDCVTKSWAQTVPSRFSGHRVKERNNQRLSGPTLEIFILLGLSNKEVYRLIHCSHKFAATIGKLFFSNFLNEHIC